MTPLNTITAELLELDSSLKAGEATGRVLTVPQSYFAGLADQMLAKVKAMDVADDGFDFAGSEPELPALLQGLRKQNPYTVPDGYFGGLQVPSFGIESPAAELENLSPLLNSIPRSTPFTVPAGYFETLVPHSVTTKQPAKVRSMFTTGWIRYAAAAVVIAFVSASAFFFVNRNTDAGADPVLARSMKNVSTQEIDELIELADEQVFLAINARDADQISKLVKNVPEKEIQDFLNETEGVESDIDEDPLLN